VKEKLIDERRSYDEKLRSYDETLTNESALRLKDREISDAKLSKRYL
jgi:hypothetical protein